MHLLPVTSSGQWNDLFNSPNHFIVPPPTPPFSLKVIAAIYARCAITALLQSAGTHPGTHMNMNIKTNEREACAESYFSANIHVFPCN